MSDAKADMKSYARVHTGTDQRKHEQQNSNTPCSEGLRPSRPQRVEGKEELEVEGGKERRQNTEITTAHTREPTPTQTPKPTRPTNFRLPTHPNHDPVRPRSKS